MTNVPDTADLIAQRLITEGCFAPTTGRLFRWPEWLHYADLEELEAAGIIRHENYGPATYGHVSYFLREA